jgi:hypothetical protein
VNKIDKVHCSWGDLGVRVLIDYVFIIRRCYVSEKQKRYLYIWVVIIWCGTGGYIRLWRYAVTDQFYTSVAHKIIVTQ